MKICSIVLAIAFGLSFEVGALTLTEMAHRVLEVNEDYAVALADERRARFRFKEAKSSFFPTINLKAGYTDQKSVFYFSGTKIESSVSQYSSSLELSQPIYLGGRIWSGYKMRRLQVETAGQALFLKKNQVLSQFFDSYLMLIAMKEQLAELNESLKVQEQLLAITRKKQKRGAVSVYELDQVLADYNSYLYRVSDTNIRYKNLQVMFFKSLNLPFQKIDGDLKIKPITLSGSPERWIEDASNKRVELRQAQANMELAEINRSLDLGEDRLSVNLFGTYGYQNPDESKLFEKDSQVHTYGLSLTLPLFSGLSSLHKKRAAEEAIFSAKKSRELVRKKIAIDVRNQYSQMKSSDRLYDIAKKWFKSSERALKKGVESFRLGKVSSLQITQLQLARERAAFAYIEAKRHHFEVQKNWQVIVGGDLQDFLKR